MRKLIVASNNSNKIREIKEILKNIPVEILSLKEAGIDAEIEETGSTFLENAYLKAKGISEIVGRAMVLADDSGLAVESLGGAPGIYSARFAGEHGNNKKNNEKLLELLEGKNWSDRHASFICAMVLIDEDGKSIEVEGKIDGIIGEEEKGTNGFGYDPIFYLQKYGMTFAEMDSETKNKISHRAKVLEKLQIEMQKLVGVV
ncbi:MAG TPA: XTP/dITP diphosphatase [Clostridiaceae bacterium]